MRIKIDLNNLEGSTTECQLAGSVCPCLYHHIYHSDANKERYTQRGPIGKYGEWFHFVTTWQF